MWQFNNINRSALAYGYRTPIRSDRLIPQSADIQMADSKRRCQAGLR
ncbi:hypothetical protein RBWH47_05934 [Rhodopirellula baltica WH47]|uniref:Uncharacterized protein n=1 Tax=Rhodopirellula baltica WH47 TaxID=991778 RepID=F2AWB0_RHOBT|nr:hypothetical protein RBWH47_05934 [Rhodopirellula baltica WH47]